MTTRLASRSSMRTTRKRVPFLAKVDGARIVVLTGDFVRWSPEGVALREVRAGVWAADLDLPPGENQYRLLVDGAWHDHAEAERRVPNPFGSENCVLTVP